MSSRASPSRFRPAESYRVSAIRPEWGLPRHPSPRDYSELCRELCGLTSISVVKGNNYLQPGWHSAEARNQAAARAGLASCTRTALILSGHRGAHAAAFLRIPDRCSKNLIDRIVDGTGDAYIHYICTARMAVHAGLPIWVHIACRNFTILYDPAAFSIALQVLSSDLPLDNYPGQRRQRQSDAGARRCSET